METAEQLTGADYEEVLADHRRLAREIDVALNGEEGAAEQASLCDLVGQAAKMRADLKEAKRLLENITMWAAGVMWNRLDYTEEDIQGDLSEERAFLHRIEWL